MIDSTRVEKDASDFTEYNHKINLNKTAELGKEVRDLSPKVQS